MRYFLIVWIVLTLAACGQQGTDQSAENEAESTVIKPAYVTPTLPNDSDDPAIWINERDPAASLIFGTDKHEKTGGLYAFTITGEIDSSRSVYPLDRPNNVDIAYGLKFADSTVDIAVVAERMTQSLRVFSIPDMTPIDGGGIPVFEDDTARAVMGIALYTNPSDGELYAIASRKENPVDEDDYLYQYQLVYDSGQIKGNLVRKFGKFSGSGEVEAIAVDNELGYIYYSDESFGVRKYYADPAKGNEELAVFGKGVYAEDREGISIYKATDSTGFVLVSDQAANLFRVYPREGTDGDPHNHPEMAVLPLSTRSSDGSEVSSVSFTEEFDKGLFVAMSDNRTFEIYDWKALEDGIKKQLK